MNREESIAPLIKWCEENLHMDDLKKVSILKTVAAYYEFESVAKATQMTFTHTLGKLIDN